MFIEKENEITKLRVQCGVDSLEKETAKTITISEIFKERNNIYRRFGLMKTLGFAIIYITLLVTSVTFRGPDSILITLMSILSYSVVTVYLLQQGKIELAIIKMQDDDEYREALKKQISRYIASTQHQDMSYPADFVKPDMEHPCYEMYVTVQETKNFLQIDFSVRLMERMNWTSLVNGDEDEKTRLFESSVTLYFTLKDLLKKWWDVARLLNDDIHIYNQSGVTKDIATHKKMADDLAREVGSKLKLDKLDAKKI